MWALLVPLDNPWCLNKLPQSVWEGESPQGKESHGYPLQPQAKSLPVSPC